MGAVLLAFLLYGCQDAQSGVEAPPSSERELLLGDWLLPGGGVGDRRYKFEGSGAFTLEVDSVTGSDTSVSTGSWSLDDSHRLTLEYEQQGVPLRPVETIFVDGATLVIGGVLVAESKPSGIVGTWYSWRTNQTGGAISAATRTIEFGDGGVGSVRTVTERTTDGQAEEPQTSTSSVQWAGEGDEFELTGALTGTWSLRGEQLVNLQGAFQRPE